MPQEGRGSLLSEGRTTQVFAWGRDRVIEVFHRRMSRDVAEREAHLTRRVHAADRRRL
jgi:hypothetical protein